MGYSPRVTKSWTQLSDFTLHRVEKREEGDRSDPKRRVKRQESNLASNQFPKYSPQPRTPRKIHRVK